MSTRLLVAFLAFLVAAPGAANAGPGRRARLSADLASELRSGNRRTVEVIVDGTDESISRVLSRQPVQLQKRLRRGAVLEVPAGLLDALASDPDVNAVANNATVTSHMALTAAATGAADVWAGLVASMGAVNGTGVGVAIIDWGSRSTTRSPARWWPAWTSRDVTATAAKTASVTERTWRGSWRRRPSIAARTAAPRAWRRAHT